MTSLGETVDWSRAASHGEPAKLNLAPGTVLGGRYEILQMLGQGGMGAVYKARDIELDRLLAVKVIRPELAGDKKTLQRFKQELILARQITHKNVIRIFDLGTHEGAKFITMEFVEGRDLSSLLEERKFTPVEAAQIVRQVCRALEAAHAENVIHRDLKPQNVMIDAAGRVLVMDFGLARSVEMSGLTQTGAVLGTPAYMSPEQAKGTPLDERSDLFSLGIIFYELLTGETPFKADTVWASLLKRTQEPAAPVMTVNPDVPQELSEIVARCLAIDPAERYQNATELALELDLWLGDTPLSTLIGQAGTNPSLSARISQKISQQRISQKLGGVVEPEPAAEKPRRLPKVAIAIAAVVVVVGFVLGWLSLQHKKPPNMVTVLVADFANHTGDPVFDGTLEPMFNVALEGARFISASSRQEARKAAAQLPQPTTKLDEQPARLVAVSQGINVIVTGSLSSRGAGYKLSVEALDAVSGKSLASAEVGTSSKDEVLLAVTKLAAPIRKALGDATPESAQLAKAETFTAGSLAAAHEYAIAQEASFAGRMEDAIRSFSKAAELDPQFGRAYSGMAAAYRNLGQRQETEKYFKMAIESGGRMTERERFRTRGAYYAAMGKYQNCIEELNALVAQYPFDNIGHNNLAICYSRLRNMPKAVEEAKKAVEIAPKAAMSRMNLSLYASYAGDFHTGEQEARAVQQMRPGYEKSYFSLAYAQLGQGQLAQAAETYQKQEKVSKLGASYANAGLGDLAIYEGRFTDALRLLESGAAAELADKRPDRAAARYAALAYTQLLRGQKSQALTAIDKALANSKGPKLRFLAGRLLASAGEASRAKEIAASLASETETEQQVYARLIQGEASLQSGDSAEAIKAFTEANRMLDTWVGRFGLGRAYMEAGLFVEADSELDRCIKRRGEAMELFVDDTPTYGYFPAVYYYQGRVREGLKSATAAESYGAYLDIRGKAGEDPLLAEVRKRAGR